MNPNTAAYRIATVYYHAERELLRRATRIIKAGGSLSDSSLVKMRNLVEYEEFAQQILGEAHQMVIDEMRELITSAARAGRSAAVMDLRSQGFAARIAPIHEDMVKLIVDDLEGALNGLPGRVLRSTSDFFQQVQATSAGQVALGTSTRINASQFALDQFARGGVTAFVDKAGRRWGADTYSEMAIRTGAMNTAITARLNTYSDNGFDLVMVSDSPRECDLCRPWEYKVLTVNGQPGSRVVPSVTSDDLVTVDVVATVEQARSEGLMHPNCTHNLTAYLPGATRTDVPTKDNPEQYVDTQEQRYCERQIRYWKKRRDVALTPDAERYANGKIREWSDRVNHLVGKSPQLRRRYERENPFRAR